MRKPRSVSLSRKIWTGVSVIAVPYVRGFVRRLANFISTVIAMTISTR